MQIYLKCSSMCEPDSGVVLADNIIPTLLCSQMSPCPETESADSGVTNNHLFLE